MQRALDISFATIALLLVLPLMGAIAVVLRFTGEGEVLFAQERVGLNGRVIRLLKFATMLKDSPNIGSKTVTLNGDPRVLPVGRFLRKTKLNELPQLVNVLMGDMSIVGPRPQARENFAAFPTDVRAVIVSVRPGLSGLGSIIFHREMEILPKRGNAVDFYVSVIAPYKGRLEAWYVEHRCVRMYLLLIALTVWVILLPNSGVVWRVFKNLPIPPNELRVPLRYCAVTGEAH